MNEYYEKEKPSSTTITPTSSSSEAKKFIKDKYVRKIWLDEEEDDPVYLYQNGDLEKSKKKKEKKEKKRKDKKRKKEEKKRRKKAARVKKQENQGDFIDFEEGDDGFGDFQEADGGNEESKKQDVGDLIGGDGFGDFVQPTQAPVKKDDDFGDFISSDVTATSASPFETPAPASALSNNLSNLYNQSQPQPQVSEPDNKYAALENMMGGGAFHQPQPQSNMFSGMTVNPSPGFPSQFQQAAFPQAQPEPSGWANPAPQAQPGFTQAAFPQAQSAFPQAQAQFPAQNGFPAAPSDPFGAPASQTYRATAPAMDLGSLTAPGPSLYKKTSAQPAETGADMFGLKATLKSQNKIHKYNKPMGGSTGGFSNTGSKSKINNTGAFSGLVSTQWNS